MNRIEKAIRAKQSNAGHGQPWDYQYPHVMQSLIDSGQAWRMEGSCGRAAMSMLEQGACFLPETAHSDYWGNRVPSRNDLKEGTRGTLSNAARYWNVNTANKPSRKQGAK